MKKVLLPVILLTGVISFLVGCGSSEKVSGDERFIKEASKSINQRWDSQTKAEKKGYKENEIEEILTNEINGFEEYKELIVDKELLKLADDYIEGNKLQIEGEKSEDAEVAYEYLVESEKLRKPALVSLVDDYGLVIDKQNEQTYKDFKAKASVIKEDKEGEKFAEKLAANMEFKKSKEYDWTTFETIVENTTDINFSSITYSVQIKDAEGIVVDNTYIYLDNFESGSKQKVDFSTDKKVKNVLVKLDNYIIKK